jgi:hypothetical protein
MLAVIARPKEPALSAVEWAAAIFYQYSRTTEIAGNTDKIINQNALFFIRIIRL